uniref:Uncharacterized protein n=1 Tax=Nelumbo nucifera TaxID=4432 RepID=A0A822Y7K5_NELNU|nr:TPA_asm: hypothetical protein HUJ06_031472 [Nelumbo nucifera]
MVKNPSFPQPNLHSTDELFIDGVLLPLHLPSHHSNPPDLEPKPNAEEMHAPEPESEPRPRPKSADLLSESPPVFSTFKRWGDIFKKGERKAAAVDPLQPPTIMKTEIKTRRKKGKVAVVRTQQTSTSIYGHSRDVQLGITATNQRWPLEGQLLGRLVAPLVHAITQLGSTSSGNGQVVLVEVESMWGGVAQFGKYGVEAPTNDVSSAIGNGCSHEQGHGVASSRSGTFYRCEMRMMTT